MTHEEMDCEGDFTLDESQINDKDETEKENTHLVRLHHVNFFDFRPRPINCMAFDPLSKKMAIARFDSDAAFIEIWNTVDNWYCEQTLTSCPSVEAMVWHGSRLFCAGLSGDLVEFDLRSGKLKESIPCNFGPIWCLAVNKKEKVIAVGTESGSVVFFEILETEIKYRNVISRQGKILSICWHEELNLIITGGYEVMVWDVRTSEIVQRISTSTNKETKIWAVAVTDDFTIITGDSSGHTTFCFGKPGHISHRKRFLSHGADIHSVSISPKGDKVCVAGVDGMVTFTASMENTYEVQDVSPMLQQKTWITGKKATHHISDVKAVEFVDDETVVTAGLDCQTIIYNLQKKKLRKVSYVQQKFLVHTARKAKCLLLQHPCHLELWSIGESSGTGEKRGDIVEMDKFEENLLKIKSKSNIISSCIGSNAKAILFSNESGTSAYWIKMNEEEGKSKIGAIPVTCPPELSRSISSHLQISPNSNILASVSKTKRLIFVDLRANMKQGVISKQRLHVDTCTQDLKFNSKSTQLALACANFGVRVFDVKTGELVCSLPKRESPVYSIDIHPFFCDKILLSHMDGTIAEVSISSNSYTKRSLLWTTSWQQVFANHLSHNKIGTKFKVMYDQSAASSTNKDKASVSGGDKLICQHDSGFSIVDWTMDLSKPPQKRKRGDDEPTRRTKALRFKHTKVLFHVDMLDEDNMIIVERNASDLMATFAPTFKKHKYGT